MERDWVMKGEEVRTATRQHPPTARHSTAWVGVPERATITLFKYNAACTWKAEHNMQTDSQLIMKLPQVTKVHMH